MKYIQQRIQVAEVTKLTVAALVFLALALSGGSDVLGASEESYEEKGVEFFESKKIATYVGGNGRFRERVEEDITHEFLFVDDSGKQLDVFVDGVNQKVVRIEGGSFEST